MLHHLLHLMGSGDDVAGVGRPELPFEFVRVLAARGAPAAALAVQQARGRAAASPCSAEEALDEAHTLLNIRLHCGLLTQAFSEARYSSRSATLLCSPSTHAPACLQFPYPRVHYITSSR